VSYYLTRQAEIDIEEVLTYLAERNLQAAKNYRAEFTKAFELIAEQPRIGAPRFDYASSLRLWTVAPYLIFYRLSEAVEITRVLHGARNITSDSFRQ